LIIRSEIRIVYFIIVQKFYGKSFDDSAITQY
jgi:hypothetical protein